MVALPLLSVAVGASNVQAAPCSTVLLVLLHVMTGAVVSTTVTFWLQELLLPQGSVACQVRVASKVLPQWPVTLVTVLRIVIVALPLLSVAVGVSKVQATLCSTVLLVLPHVITGAVVSTTITFWLQELLLPQASVACQVRVASTVLVVETVAALQVSTATGGSKVHGAPCSTVLLPAQVMVGAIRSATITV